MNKLKQTNLGEIIAYPFKRVYKRVYRSRTAQRFLSRFTFTVPPFRNLIKETLILCPLCASFFKKVGADHSEFLPCPLCGTNARDRVAIQLILHEISAQNGEGHLIFDGAKVLQKYRLLECSPRRDEYRRSIMDRSLGQYVASDYDLNSHRADIQLDLTSEADANHFQEQFDIIVCAHVLEHIPEYRVALRNLFQMLAPGGFLILQVPLLEAQYTKVTWDEFHGDNTRVYHRFGFDLLNELDPIFDDATPVVGQLDFPITSPEISKQKYVFLDSIRDRCLVLGENLLRYHGLGCPDLCDAFIARKAKC